MKNLVVSRHALYASAAAVFLAACSTTEAPAPSISAPDSPSFVVPSAAGVVQVCLDAASSGAYTYTFTYSNPVDGGSVANPDQVGVPNPGSITEGVGPQCLNAYTRINSPDLDNGSITVTANSPLGVTGTFSFICSDDVAAGDPLCAATAGVNGATGSMNSAHGATIEFTFIEVVPPPPPPPPSIDVPLFVIGDVEPHAVNDIVNFWGAQWWKYNFMSGFVATGVASFKGYASSADNFCGGTWVSRVGNSPPPAAAIPTRFNILVTSTVTKNGPDIGGNIVQILTIDQDGNYGPSPGNKSFGTVVSVKCSL